MIGRMHHVVLDCPDPDALAAFYSALLGLPVTYRDDDWVVVAASDASSGLAFQRASGNEPPTWPDPAVPQQFHLDIMVEDVATAGPQVLALGAAKLDGENVYADPAGHPFCLIRRPRWAPPFPTPELSHRVLPKGEASMLLSTQRALPMGGGRPVLTRSPSTPISPHRVPQDVGAPYQREAAHAVSMTMPGRTCVMSTRPAPCQNAAGPGGRWR